MLAAAMREAAVTVWVAAVVAVLCCGTAVHARLVFPKGSDMGYIVADGDAVDKLTVLEQELLRQNSLGFDAGSRSRDLRAVLDREEGLALLLGGYRSMQDLQGDRGKGRGMTGGSTLDCNTLQGGCGGGMGSVPSSLRDKKHGVKMGVPDVHCDDGMNNLSQDWDYSPANYTCYTPRYRLPPSTPPLGEGPLPPLLSCDNVPRNYMPQHYCMNQTIAYGDRIPTHGAHRPLWAKFGEYRFLPAQRWLHNVEHGSIVMLYHPCTEPSLVTRLRQLVTSCLYKHVITPYTALTPQRPLALVAWGCRLEMSSVDAAQVRYFMRTRALQGPEGLLRRQGHFSEGLVSEAAMPGDGAETDAGLEVCPDEGRP